MLKNVDVPGALQMVAAAIMLLSPFWLPPLSAEASRVSAMTVQQQNQSALPSGALTLETMGRKNQAMPIAALGPSRAPQTR